MEESALAIRVEAFLAGDSNHLLGVVESTQAFLEVCGGMQCEHA